MCLGPPLGSHMGGRSVGQKKIRHHVNPLKSVHMKPLALPIRWPEHRFAQPSQPLHVDIGCARGLFCLDLAANQPGTNVLGLEIRAVLAEAAAEDARRLMLGNAHFLACNANANLDRILERGTACSPLRSVSIQFPDPWFKSRHHKRRVVQPALVEAIARHLSPGGWLFVQSDVLELAESARETVREAGGALLADACGDDLARFDAPKPSELALVATERERASSELGRPVYRSLWTKM